MDKIICPINEECPCPHLSSTSKVKVLESSNAALLKRVEDAEQLQVQLAGCLTAAEGATKPPNVATKGMYGWSHAYQSVLDLRLKYDALCEAAKDAEIYLQEADYDICHLCKRLNPQHEHCESCQDHEDRKTTLKNLNERLTS